MCPWLWGDDGNRWVNWWWWQHWNLASLAVCPSLHWPSLKNQHISAYSQLTAISTHCFLLKMAVSVLFSWPVLLLYSFTVFLSFHRIILNQSNQLPKKLSKSVWMIVFLLFHLFNYHHLNHHHLNHQVLKHFLRWMIVEKSMMIFFSVLHHHLCWPPSHLNHLLLLQWWVNI